MIRICIYVCVCLGLCLCQPTYHRHLPIEFSALTADFEATDAPSRSVATKRSEPSVSIHAGEFADDVAQGELPDTVIERRRMVGGLIIYG